MYIYISLLRPKNYQIYLAWYCSKVKIMKMHFISAWTWLRAIAVIT